MIYSFLKRIVKVCLAVFFRKIVVHGKENIPKNGPLIIVANHPNTFLDPLIIAALTKQQTGFIANASIFGNVILRKIFNYFNVIPVYRQKDIKPGVIPDNEKTFRKCIDYLSKNGTILVFPEGSSYYELKLRKIKTGTARIALSHESFHQYKSNLKICAVALDYSDAIQFRSMVSVTINPAFTLEEYHELYKTQHFEGVNKLTERIRKELAKNVTHTKEKDQEEFLIRAHKFYYTFEDPSADLFKNPKDSLLLRNQLSKAIKYLKLQNKALYHDLENNLYLFYNLLKTEEITAGILHPEFLAQSKWRVLPPYFFTFFVFSPFYLFGLVANYLPYIIPSKFFYRLKTDIEYKTSVEMIGGLLTFPLFYFLEIWLFRAFVSHNFWLTLLLLLALPLSGYFAMYYYTQTMRFVRILKFYFFIPKQDQLKMLDLRNKIIDQMALARKYFE